MSKIKTLFLDTNILLHYPALVQIDWRTLSDADVVKLVICLQVIEELDEKKSDPQYVDRVQRRIKEIRTFHESHEILREGVSLVVFNEELRREDFPGSLSPDRGDDRIVRLIQRYLSGNPSEAVAVVTEDYGMELRCQAHGLCVIRCDPATRLQVPSDELTKKVRQQEGELLRLKNRQPRFVVRAVPDSLNPIETESFEADLANTVDLLDVDAEVAAQHRQLDPARSIFGNTATNTAMRMLASKAEIQRYDGDLSRYFKDYADYVERHNAWAIRRAKSIEFKLWLGNIGSQMATEIDLTVTFPQRFTAIVDIEKMENKGLAEPSPPCIPEKPRPLLATGIFTSDLASQFSHLAVAQPMRDQYGSFVYNNGDSGWGIHATENRLKHFKWHFVGQFVAEFDTWDNVRPFEAIFDVTAAEVPEVTEGRILFKVNRVE